jgi:predicted MFS family arabinose efflux permease
MRGAMNDKRAIWGLFVPLYMSQFLAIGFLFTALTAISRDRGGELEDIGVIYVLGMVWAVKFLWAPLVDRFGSSRRGHYRSWLLWTQPLMAVALLGIIPFDVIADIWVILALLAVVAILSATQDVATDALAVRSISGRNRGGINGLQVGAGFVGDIIGGGLVLVVYDWWGWTPAILTLAVCTALPVLGVARYREPELVQVTPSTPRPSMRSLFRQRGAVRWAFVLTPLMALGMPGAYGLLVPIMIDSGVSVGSVGLLTNGLGGVVGCGAAIVAGMLIHRLGRKRALVLYGLGQVVAIAAVLPVVWNGGLVWVLTAIVLLNIFNTASYAAMYTINMDYARPASAGSDFTVQTSISYALRFAGAGAVLGFASSLGYTWALVICMGLALLGVVATVALFVEKDGVSDSVPGAEPAVPSPNAVPVQQPA